MLPRRGRSLPVRTSGLQRAGDRRGTWLLLAAVDPITGAMLAFASGTLISALAFELFPEAVELGGLRPAGLGLLVGAATFVVINTWLDSRVAPPEQVAEQPAAGPGRPGGESGADAEAAATARGEGELPRELAGAAAEQREKVAVASQGSGWPCWPP